MKKIATVLTGFVVLLGSASQGFSIELTGSESQVQSTTEMPYVSGGIGVEEREALQATAEQDNLRLSFALENGNYLGSAEVVIKNANGLLVLEEVSDGPLFFVKLPAGNYTVEATAMGKTLEQVAHVPSKGHAQVHFAWKEPDQNDIHASAKE